MNAALVLPISFVVALSIIVAPPMPSNSSPQRTFLPIVARGAAWSTALTLSGNPFTDAVSINGALFVSRQDGNIYRDGQLWAVVPVNATGEGGLNSLATDGRRLWAGYVSAQSRIVVAEIVNRAPVVLADFGPAAEEHNAAGLLYTNGRLLFGIGDNESAYTAQSATLNGGKLWWVDPVLGDVTPAAKGFRNPWHITQIGTQIFISDVGESKFEEVNVFTQGGNYGWPCFEGLEPRAYDPETCDGLEWVTPAVMYGHGNGRAVVGMAMLNDAKVLADFDGTVYDFSMRPVKKFDGLISKMTPIAGTHGDVAVMTMKAGVATVEVWR